MATFATAVCACRAIAAPALSIDGTYALERVTGDGPASGTLVLTHQGYAERRVRFRETDSTMSKEYLARGTVVVRLDSALQIELWIAGDRTGNPWTPEARWSRGIVELRHDDGAGGQVIEVYRRKEFTKP